MFAVILVARVTTHRRYVLEDARKLPAYAGLDAHIGTYLKAANNQIKTTVKNMLTRGVGTAMAAMLFQTQQLKVKDQIKVY